MLVQLREKEEIFQAWEAVIVSQRREIEKALSEINKSLILKKLSSMLDDILKAHRPLSEKIGLGLLVNKNVVKQVDSQWWICRIKVKAMFMYSRIPWTMTRMFSIEWKIKKFNIQKGKMKPTTMIIYNKASTRTHLERSLQLEDLLKCIKLYSLVIVGPIVILVIRKKIIKQI